MSAREGGMALAAWAALVSCTLLLACGGDGDRGDGGADPAGPDAGARPAMDAPTPTVDGGVVARTDGGTVDAGQTRSEPVQAECELCDGTCDFPASYDLAGECVDVIEGVFAVRSELDVFWQGNDVVAGGRGTVRADMLALVEGFRCGGGLERVQLALCDLELPVLQAADACEAYALQLPQAIWDLPTMPSYLTLGERGFDAGEELAFDASTFHVGVEVNPGDGPLPTLEAPQACPSGVGQACLPDHDDDGRVALTAELELKGDPPACAQGGASLLSSLPVGDTRATAVRLGLRARLPVRATMDCNAGAGQPEAGTLQLTVWDCELEGGAACDGSHARAASAAIPTFTALDLGASPQPALDGVDGSPSGGPRSAVVRLGDALPAPFGDGFRNRGFDCAAVRAADFPDTGR